MTAGVLEGRLGSLDKIPKKRKTGAQDIGARYSLPRATAHLYTEE